MKNHRIVSIASLSRLALALLAAAAGNAAQAQSRMAPGLWEQTVTTKMQDSQMDARMAEAQARLASLPPEQRKMVEAQMQAHGMQMGPHGTTIRTCVTKEQAERDPQPPAESRCTREKLDHTGNTWKYKFTCTGENGRPPTSGEGTFTMTSSTSYTGVTSVEMPVQGKPTKVDSQVTGKWLGADCGSVQPVSR